MDDPGTQRWRWPGARWGHAGVLLRRVVATTVVTVAVTLGSAPPLGAQGAETMGPPTDGGSQARWVAGELALLVVGSIAGRMWMVRRSRRREPDGSAENVPGGDTPGLGCGRERGQGRPRHPGNGTGRTGGETSGPHGTASRPTGDDGTPHRARSAIGRGRRRKKAPHLVRL